MRIPNVTHFVFGLREQREPFHLVHYLCLESCRRVLQPDAIFFHHKHIPYGPYWDLIEPYLTLREVELAPEVLDADYDDVLVPHEFRYAHHADFVRLDALIEHGGIYADIDTLFVRPFPDEWFEHPFVIGEEDPVRDELTGEVRPSLCNALLLSKPGATFARTWREEMASALNGTWSNHSNFLAHKLSVRLPAAAHVLPRRAFFEFGPSVSGLDSIFERLETDLDDVFSIHLWSHLWWDEGRRDFTDVHAGAITESFVREADTTYSVLARPFLPARAERLEVRNALRIDYLSLSEGSGYGVAARRAIDALRVVGADVAWRPFAPGGGWGLGYAPLDSAQARPEPDVAVAHLTPEYYPQVRDLYPDVPLAGHTVWETDRLPAHWPELLEIPDLLVVPCAWNAEVIRDAGVSTPIEIVPHVAELSARPAVEPLEVDPETFVFYTIGSWTARKDIGSTVRAYLQAFSSKDRVLLVIKTGAVDHTVVARDDETSAHYGTTPWSLAHVIGQQRDAADVQLITRELSDAEVRGIHERGDCYVSLCHSEGWGLTSFDAAATGTPVVITGYGGQLEYLDDTNAFLVDYELVPVDDPAGEGSYTPDQRWAEPRIAHAAELLQSVRADPGAARDRAAAARDAIRERYAPENVGSRFMEALSGIDAPARPNRLLRSLRRRSR